MIAVLVATASAEDETPAALAHADGVAAVARVAQQLRGSGIVTIHVLTRPEWTDAVVAAMAEVGEAGSGAAGGAGAVIVAPVDSPADTLEALAALHEGAAAGSAGGPAPRALLLASADRLPQDTLLHEGALRGLGRTTGLGSGLLPSSGMVLVAGDDRQRVAAGARELALRAERRWGSGGSGQVDVHDVVSAALSPDGKPLPEIDEERLRLNSAVKATDGFFTTFFVSPYSKYVARWAARRGFTPNQVTVVSMLLGIAAAGGFATGTRLGLVLGAICLQVAFTADCVDGQLARYSRQFSSLGAWLDSVFDRSKEYLVFAGLALGATRTGDNGVVWLLAAAALALQTTRHAIDFSWGPRQLLAAGAAGGAAPARSLHIDPPGAPDQATVGGAGEGSRVGALAALGNVGVTASQRTETGWIKWVKRAAVLPIGERFALISVTAAVFDARTTFVALLTWGLFALAYSVTGRVLRTVA